MCAQKLNIKRMADTKCKKGEESWKKLKARLDIIFRSEVLYSLLVGKPPLTPSYQIPAGTMGEERDKSFSQIIFKLTALLVIVSLDILAVFSLHSPRIWCNNILQEHKLSKSGSRSFILLPLGAQNRKNHVHPTLPVWSKEAIGNVSLCGQ